ncbi:MAG: ABC transporter ATP-binding protein [Fimbriimonadales bacterium]
MSAVLEIRDAEVSFNVPGGRIRAVDGVSLTLNEGETLAVVGESGCGKTTLAKAILGLEPLSAGAIEVQGLSVTPDLRGLAKRVGIVWQDPYASLDPRWRIGRSIAEPLIVNDQRLDGRVDEVMRQVGLDLAMKERFPHQLSGGQRQRVAVARALALGPPLVLCDEPKAALDLSIRAQILNLLKDLQSKLSCAYLYISHDLTTVRFIADRVAVMYLGRFVEVGKTEKVFTHPRHPYTRALLESAPTLETIGRLPAVLPGEIPDPREVAVGCPFKTRCPNKLEVCETVFPDPSEDGERVFYCHNPVGTATL